MGNMPADDEILLNETQQYIFTTFLQSIKAIRPMAGLLNFDKLPERFGSTFEGLKSAFTQMELMDDRSLDIEKAGTTANRIVDTFDRMEMVPLCRHILEEMEKIETRRQELVLSLQNRMGLLNIRASKIKRN